MVTFFIYLCIDNNSCKKIPGETRKIKSKVRHCSGEEICINNYHQE